MTKKVVCVVAGAYINGSIAETTASRACLYIYMYILYHFSSYYPEENERRKGLNSRQVFQRVQSIVFFR